MREREAGFTLLEILIVVVISSLLIGTAVQTYIALARATARTLAENRRDAVGALVLDRLESELTGTLLIKRGKDDEPAKFPWIFLGEDGGPGDRTSDSIRFITQTPARAAGSLSGVGLRLVSYTVGATDGDREALFRAEDPLPSAAPDAPNFETTPAVDDVFKLKIRYQDEDGQWLTSWNSRAEPNDNTLPLAVELTLQLEEKDAEGVYKTGREQTRLVALPLRAIGGDDDDDTACDNDVKTVSECLDSLTIDLSDDKVKVQVDDIRAKYGKECLNTAGIREKFEAAAADAGVDKRALAACM